MDKMEMNIDMCDPDLLKVEISMTEVSELKRFRDVSYFVASLIDVFFQLKKKEEDKL